MGRTTAFPVYVESPIPCHAFGILGTLTIPCFNENWKRSKDMMIEQEQNLGAAAGYLVAKGYLQQCPYHEQIYGGGYDDLSDGDFYRFAMADRNRGDNGPVAWASHLEAREYTDLLKEANEEHAADECGWCAKHRDA